MPEIKEMTVEEIRSLLKTSSLSNTGGVVMMKIYPLPPGVELKNDELYKGAFSCDVATYTLFQHQSHSHTLGDISEQHRNNQTLVPGLNCVTVVKAIGGYDSLIPMALRVDLVPGKLSTGWFYTGLEVAADISFTVLPDDEGNEYAYFYANNRKDDSVLCSINEVLIKIVH
ncbi:hypothetical protein CENTIMANUS_00339 [Klebsiella phage vB_KpM_Centimanus]